MLYTQLLGIVVRIDRPQSHNNLFHTLADAEWFDMNNRDELPTKVANSMIHISGAIGRQMADLFANIWSSAGCLAGKKANNGLHCATATQISSLYSNIFFKLNCH